jgi:ribonucleoside-diphosphate reductase beta chain
LRNVFNDASEIFDSMKLIPEITTRAKLVADRADELIDCATRYNMGLHKDKKEVKRRLYLYLVAINALEAIQFPFSFACSLNFGQTQRMKGNAAEIQLIANDEAVHVAFSTALIRLLPTDDQDYLDIIRDNKEEATALYHAIIDAEKANCGFVLSKGSMMGMNEQIGLSFIDYCGYRSMKSINLEYALPSPKSNPLPWMKGIMNESDIQKPPQETDLTGYMKGLKADVDENTFGDFEL